MGTEQLATNSIEQDDRNFDELRAAQEGLKYIESELDNGDDHLVNTELLDLTNRIASWLESQKDQGDLVIDNYDELADLMRSVVAKVQQGEDLYADQFDPTQEKQLLVELMWSVLAKIGRQKESAKVAQFSQEAIAFYDGIGLGGLYQILLRNAA